jgi:hypothetical protein
MKIYLSFLLAAILITVKTEAQHVNLGIKGGLNFYTIHNDNNVKYDTKVGFNAGFLGHIHLSSNLAVQPEIVYSSQGAKYTVNGVTTKINLGYINLPVLIQYMFDNGFRLQAGPQVGFLVNAKSETGNTSTDIKNNLSLVDFSIVMGISYVNPSTGFGIDGRYNLGFGNINENNAVKSTNRGFKAGVFYLFRHRS